MPADTAVHGCPGLLWLQDAMTEIHRTLRTPHLPPDMLIKCAHDPIRNLFWYLRKLHPCRL